MKRIALGLAALVAVVGIAFGAGQFPGYPIVGGAAYCVSYVMNPTTGLPTTTCNGPQTPAGPVSITGSELIPADTQLPSGQQPQTVTIPSSLLSANGQGGFRNLLVGGDFALNLWQRGTTFTALTPTVAAMTADRWFTYSSGNTVTITRQTGASDILPTQGLLASMRVSRPSGTDVTPICVGQYLSAKDSAVLVGKSAIFSFYAMAPTTFSPTNDAVDVSIAYTTAADSATPGTNTATFALSTTTGYTAVGALNIPLTQTFTRYSTSGAIPSTATSVGVKICFTPAASTGASTDWFEFAGAQLEANLSSITTPGSFARRPLQVETNLQLSYSYVLTDTAITTTYGWCQEKVANTSANCTLQFPQQMRGIPTTTVSATGWSIQQTDATNELCSALAGVASSNTVLEARLLCTAPGTIALGTVSPFLGGATTSTITFSSEP